MMSDAMRRRIGRTMVAFTVAITIVSIVVNVRYFSPHKFYDLWLLHNSIGVLAFATVGWLLIGAQPNNRAAWVFPWTGLFQALGIAGTAMTVPTLSATQSLSFSDASFAGVGPDDVTTVASLGYFFETWSWLPGIAPLVTLALLWFPDGSLPSSRWRPVPIVASAAIVVLTSGLAWSARPFGLTEFELWEPNALEGFAFMVLGSTMVLSVVAVIAKYRHTSGVARRQFRWIAWASGVLAISWVVANLADLYLSNEVASDVFKAVSLPSLLVYLGAYALAIWRHQLFDIDVVISRTLIYSSLLLTIGALYAAVIFGVGSLIGRQSVDSPLLPMVATVLIAVVFHPVRVRFERIANQLVFGRRATPYEVLSQFAGSVAASDGRLLTTIAESLAAGTVASGSTVWSVEGERLHVVSHWPEGSVPNTDRTFPIEHGGMVIGRLGLGLPPGEALPPADEALVADLTNGIGLALWNQRLTRDLVQGVDDLRASRRRLVAVQDETRYKLERDLHDGAQQRLVAIKVRLSIALQIAQRDGAPTTAQGLETLCRQADDVIESLRDFARGVYPPLLQAEGLEAALRMQLARSTLPISHHIDVANRHPRELESTAYFTVLESLIAFESAGVASAITIEVDGTDDCLDVTIRAQHGPEFRFVNPTHLAHRADALGGSFSCDMSPDRTKISAQLPVSPEDVVTHDLLVGV